MLFGNFDFPDSIKIALAKFAEKRSEFASQKIFNFGSLEKINPNVLSENTGPNERRFTR